MQAESERKNKYIKGDVVRERIGGSREKLDAQKEIRNAKQKKTNAKYARNEKNVIRLNKCLEMVVDSEKERRGNGEKEICGQRKKQRNTNLKTHVGTENDIVT